MRLSEGVQIVGGLRAPRLKAPFARATVVLSDALGQLYIPVKYHADGEVIASALPNDEWQHLLKANEAHALETQVPAFYCASMWIFREPIEPTRNSYLEDLRRVNALKYTETIDTAVSICVVDELLANPVRDEWSRRLFNDACSHLGQGDSKKAVTLADRSWLFDRFHLPERVALYCLALVESGQQTEADKVISSAENSYGDQYVKKARDLISFYRGCHVLPRTPPLLLGPMVTPITKPNHVINTSPVAYP